MNQERVVLDEESKDFQNLRKEWVEQAKTMTLENLVDFLKHLMHDYKHDYGTVCHAMAIGSYAAFRAMDREPQGGITGFQAGAIMWEIVKLLCFPNNKLGLRLINFDHLLYPQYADHFEKSISKSQWERLQAEAKRFLSEKDQYVDAKVREHWESIANGEVPFGFEVVE